MFGSRSSNFFTLLMRDSSCNMDTENAIHKAFAKPVITLTTIATVSLISHRVICLTNSDNLKQFIGVTRWNSERHATILAVWFQLGK